MGWHLTTAFVNSLCSQGRAGASSAESSSDGGACAPSKSTVTRAACSRRGKTTGALSRSQSGTMFAHLTESRGGELLTWFREGFRARTSALPARAPESTGSGAGCGGSLRGSFARFDRVSSSWRTPQCSLLAGLDVFLETWPRWGLMRGGACWALSTPARRTGGSGFGLWRTPRAGKASAENEESWMARHLAGKVARLWPTPNCEGWRSDGELQMLGRLDLSDPEVKAMTARATMSKKTRWLPTPTAQDAANNGAASQFGRNSKPLNAVAGGALNPQFVEWLMGWPLEWTRMEPLPRATWDAWLRAFATGQIKSSASETGRCRRAPRWPGEFYHDENLQPPDSPRQQP